MRPGAAANSLKWLKAQYGADVPETIDDLRDKLKDKDHMKTTRHKNGGGTEDDDFIDGKLKYIDDNKDLNLAVKFMDDDWGGGNRTVGNTTAVAKGLTPTMDFLFDEINHGEDVEIGMTWLAPEYLDRNGNGKRDRGEPDFDDANGNGKPDPGEFTDINGNGKWDADGVVNGGHWITATAKISLLFGAARGIWFHEDTKQGERYTDTNDNGKWDAGEPYTDGNGNGNWDANDGVGTGDTGFSWLTTRPDGFLELINLPGGRNKIDIIVSESIPEPCSLIVWSLLAALGIAIGWRRRRSTVI